MSNELALVKKDTVDVVAARIRQLLQSGELHLPPNYSAENALKAAWLVLQSTLTRETKPVLQACTRDSIANALLDMVVQGLNPVKKQGYFIAYGQQLVFQRSYFGDMALVQRVLPGAEIYYGVVYEGDEFDYTIERGRKQITKHVQRLEHVDPSKIRAAYCVIEDKDGRLVHTEIMTIDQIKQSWKQSRQYDPSGAKPTPHHTFTDQMALRTVIRRACKAVINASSDDYLLLHHMHRSDELAAEAEIEAEVAANANGRVIDVEPAAVTDAPADGEPAAEPEQAQPVAVAAQAAPRAAETPDQLQLGPGF